MSNEQTRLSRNAVQAIVAILVSFLAGRGIDVDPELLYPLVGSLWMTVGTWLVGLAERRLHSAIGVLNGPRKQPQYALAA